MFCYIIKGGLNRRNGKAYHFKGRFDDNITDRSISHVPKRNGLTEYGGSEGSVTLCVRHG
jgi:hypothetical protein